MVSLWMWIRPLHDCCFEISVFCFLSVKSKVLSLQRGKHDNSKEEEKDKKDG